MVVKHQVGVKQQQGQQVGVKQQQGHQVGVKQQQGQQVGVKQQQGQQVVVGQHPSAMKAWGCSRCTRGWFGWWSSSSRGSIGWWGHNLNLLLAYHYNKPTPCHLSYYYAPLVNMLI